MRTQSCMANPPNSFTKTTFSLLLTIFTSDSRGSGGFDWNWRGMETHIVLVI